MPGAEVHIPAPPPGPTVRWLQTTDGAMVWSTDLGDQMDAVTTLVDSLGVPTTPTVPGAPLVAKADGTGWFNEAAPYLAGIQVISANTLLANYSPALVAVDTSSAGWTVTLPAAPVEGSGFIFRDHAATWNTNNVTINPNGLLIDGLAGNAVYITKNGIVDLVFQNGGWWHRLRRRTVRTPSGRWLAPSNGTTLLLTQAKEMMLPFSVEDPNTLTAIGLEITTAGSAGSLIRLGVRRDDGTGLPGKLLRDAGTIDGTVLFATTPGQITGLTDPLPVGVYWLICAGQGAPVTQPTVRAFTVGNTQVTGTSLPGNTSWAGYQENGTATTGAFVSSPPAYAPTSPMPRVCIKT